jgi:flagellar hook assembly protein FlgD
MADSQKMGKAVSGGQKIDDHSFWAGSKSKSSVFPDGPHKEKMESSAEGAGSLKVYEDTTEKIKAQQVEGVRQIKNRPLKPLYRN